MLRKVLQGANSCRLAAGWYATGQTHLFEFLIVDIHKIWN